MLSYSYTMSDQSYRALTWRSNLALFYAIISYQAKMATYFNNYYLIFSRPTNIDIKKNDFNSNIDTKVTIISRLCRLHTVISIKLGKKRILWKRVYIKLVWCGHKNESKWVFKSYLLYKPIKMINSTDNDDGKEASLAVEMKDIPTVWCADQNFDTVECWS